MSSVNACTKDNLLNQWEEWPLLVQETLPSSSAVSVPGRPIKVSCCHTGRIAVAYRKTPNSPRDSRSLLNSHCLLTSPPTLTSSPNLRQNSSYLNAAMTLPQSSNFTSRFNPTNKESAVHIGIFQCESTGGSQWILEQTIVLDRADPTANHNSSAGSADIPHVMGLMPKEYCQGPPTKNLVHLDWVSQENGSHILTVGIGTKIFMYGRLSGKPPELCLPSDASRDRSSSCLVLLRSVDLVSSVEGSLPIPVSLSWVRDGILVVGMDCEMHVYSQWQPPAPPKTTAQDTDITSSFSSITSAVRQSQDDGAGPGSLLSLPKRAVTRSMMSLAQKLSGKRTAYDLPVEMEDSGLFEAAQQLFPTLPQYHPVQLLELMDLGKVSWKLSEMRASHLILLLQSVLYLLHYRR